AAGRVTAADGNVDLAVVAGRAARALRRGTRIAAVEDQDRGKEAAAQWVVYDARIAVGRGRHRVDWSAEEVAEIEGGTIRRAGLHVDLPGNVGHLDDPCRTHRDLRVRRRVIDEAQGIECSQLLECARRRLRGLDRQS